MTKRKKDPVAVHANPVPHIEQRVVQYNRHEAVFSGPLPHPADFERYEATHHGAANRILTMAEEQGTHRRRMESRLSWVPVFGQVSAFIISAMLIVCAFILIREGKELSGFGVVATTIGSLLTVYLKNGSRKQKAKESAENETGT